MQKKNTFSIMSQMMYTIVVFIFIFLILFCLLKCHFNLCYSDIGAIGSAFGGFMGPVIGGITIYVLYHTFKAQKESIEQVEINQQLSYHNKYLEDGIKEDLHKLEVLITKIKDINQANEGNPLQPIPLMIGFQTFEELLTITSKVYMAISDGKIFYRKQPLFLKNVSDRIIELKLDQKLNNIDKELQNRSNKVALENPYADRFHTMAEYINKNLLQPLS